MDNKERPQAGSNSVRNCEWVALSLSLSLHRSAIRLCAPCLDYFDSPGCWQTLAEVAADRITKISPSNQNHRAAAI